jgi:hypothetical protein
VSWAGWLAVTWASQSSGEPLACETCSQGGENSASVLVTAAGCGSAHFADGERPSTGPLHVELEPEPWYPGASWSVPHSLWTLTVLVSKPRAEV